MDLIIAILSGFLGGGFGSKILLWNFDLPNYVKYDIKTASIIASSILIFFVTQVERFRIIDDELSIFKRIKGDNFHENKEIEKMKRDCND